jgi:hypothetical protein
MIKFHIIILVFSHKVQKYLSVYPVVMKTITLLAATAAIAALAGMVITTIAGNGIIMQQAEASSCQTHGDFADPSTQVTKCSSPKSQGDQFNHNYHLSDPT